MTFRALPRPTEVLHVAVVVLLAQAGCTTEQDIPNGASANASGQATPYASNANVTSMPSGPSQAQNQTRPVAASNPNIRFVGRVQTTDANGPILSWPATEIIAGFAGTRVGVRLKTLDQGSYPGVGNANNWFGVSIDGIAMSPIQILQGTLTYTLATDLKPGQHTVRLIKRTESQIGSVQFLGFVLDANASLAPGPDVPSRRIEFIGDSTIAGYGTLGASAACSFSAATEDASVSYAAVAAQLLMADAHLIGYSGKGIVQNDDEKDDPFVTMPVIWTYQAADTQRSTGTWDPNQWVPQAVVVIVGGNDFNSTTPNNFALGTNKEETLFNTTAVAFLKHLRLAYPEALIFVGPSPIYMGPSYKLYAPYAEGMVSAAQDANIIYMAIPSDDGSRGLGCDGHPNAATDALVGAAIADAMAAKMGWN